MDGLNGDDWGKWEVLERDNNKDKVSLLNNILTVEKRAYIRIKASLYIIVSKENEKKTIIDYLSDNNNKVFGESLTESQRMILISKITSFERIRKDY